ncbi:MAG: pentapeptide repeat-containing protein [Candidatus Electrothrix sp. YB6]
MTFVNSNREHFIDQRFDKDVSDIEYSNKLFLRIVAKDKRFEKVVFKHSIFDTTYFRNCVFDSCDFTGCRFVGVNLYGAKFTGCKFDYATFERTIIASDVLDNCCPGWDNLKLKFARTLRVNFQQLGDSKSANKAIKVELNATEIHLKKSWRSNESYYRKKYRGWKRIGKFLEWLNFKILDFIWGNGENTYKLTRTVILLLIVMALFDVLSFQDPTRIKSYSDAILKMPEIFLGITSPKKYPNWYIAIIFFTRLVAMGFFMSIIIKRFNRR